MNSLHLSWKLANIRGLIRQGRQFTMHEWMISYTWKLLITSFPILFYSILQIVHQATHTMRQVSNVYHVGMVIGRTHMASIHVITVHDLDHIPCREPQPVFTTVYVSSLRHLQMCRWEIMYLYPYYTYLSITKHRYFMVKTDH